MNKISKTVSEIPELNSPGSLLILRDLCLFSEAIRVNFLTAEYAKKINCQHRGTEIQRCTEKNRIKKMKRINMVTQRKE